MENYEERWVEEKKKYQNLWKMHRSILKENDEYNSALITLKNCILELQGQQTVDESDSITPQEALSLAQLITVEMAAKTKKCQCDRWKRLYMNQCEEALRLSQINNELMEQLKQYQVNQQLEQVDINQLLNDYLLLFKRQFAFPQENQPTDNKKQKRETNRNKSKGKSINSQTERKNIKPHASQLHPKEKNYIRVIMEKMERDLSQLHKGIEHLRSALIDKEKLIKIYRQKERKYMLYGDYIN